MENFGQRVQYSVFECYLDFSKLDEPKGRLEVIINLDENHIRYYSLYNKDLKKHA